MTEIIRFDQLPGSASAGSLDSRLRDGVVSIGNFDGVHIGHGTLLRKVDELAKSIDGPSVVIVFDPHPAAILRPEHIPPRLTWIQRRAELLQRHGIDFLLVCKTTKELLNLQAEDFFQWLIVDQLGAKGIVEGPNFFFGKGRGGNVDTLRKLCEQNSIECQIVEPKGGDGGDMISSTRIRQSLADGNLDQANQWLTTPYRIRGIVTKGDQRGRTIGFPTANLNQIDVVVPRDGVYGGIVPIDGKPHQAAIHIGPNPTFSDNQTQKVEVHLLDFDGDLYGQTLLVDFVTRVRDIARFDSVEKLQEQLDRDIATIRNRLANFASKGN